MKKLNGLDKMVSFKEKIEEVKEGVLIVDAMNLAFRWKHSGAEYFKDAFYETVLSLAQSYKCNRIIIAADHRGSWYRKEIYPEYKANRKELIENQTEQEKEAFEVFIREYEETLEFLKVQGLCVLRYDNTEADDIAAYLTKIIKDKTIWLVSSDRDWDLLINENVNRFSYVTRKEVTLENWYDDEKNHPVSPELYLTLKCLEGDKGDNIPGIPQVGPKRAASLIAEYGDVFQIYDACPLPGSYKYIQNLNANAEQLLLNVELMDLDAFCETALGEDACQDISIKAMEYIR